MEYSKLNLDVTSFYSEIGLKGPLEFGQQNAQSGREAAAGYSRKIVSRGDQMAAIHTGSNVVSQLAVSETRAPQTSLEMKLTYTGKIGISLDRSDRIDLFA